MDDALRYDSKTAFKILLNHLLEFNTKEESYRYIFSVLPQVVFEKPTFMEIIQFFLVVDEDEETPLNIFLPLNDAVMPPFTDKEHSL